MRAVDGNENIDPTPARYTWTVGLVDPGDPGAPVNCDNANITLTAAADGWADEVNPIENYLFETELEVRSGSTGDPAAGEPVIGQNARSFFRFPLLPENLEDCTLESATLRLYAGGFTEGRTSTPCRSRRRGRRARSPGSTSPTRSPASRRRPRHRVRATASSTSSTTCSRCSTWASTTAG